MVTGQARTYEDVVAVRAAVGGSLEAISAYLETCGYPSFASEQLLQEGGPMSLVSDLEGTVEMVRAASVDPWTASSTAVRSRKGRGKKKKPHGLDDQTAAEADATAALGEDDEAAAAAVDEFDDEIDPEVRADTLASHNRRLMSQVSELEFERHALTARLSVHELDAAVLSSAARGCTAKQTAALVGPLTAGGGAAALPALVAALRAAAPADPSGTNETRARVAERVEAGLKAARASLAQDGDAQGMEALVVSACELIDSAAATTVDGPRFAAYVEKALWRCCCC